jgi:ketosteroid isomerase-like protein
VHNGGKGLPISFQMVVRFILIALTSLFPAWATAQPKTGAGDQSEVVQTVRTLFNALETSNDAQFTSVVTSDFYMFDGGTRFSGQQILSLMKALRAAGKSYKWNVSGADVHVIGNTAWVAYVNKGSITDSSGTKDQEWLESAFLERQGVGWKIAFTQSTRVPEANSKRK